MKRIVWIAATILIMIGIMGFGLYTMKSIDRVNQERREKEEGEKFASQIIIMTETTSIWDKVRSAQETTTTAANNPNGAPVVPPDAVPAGDPVQTAPGEAAPAETLAAVPEDNGFAEPNETPREQTTAAAIVVTLD